VLAAREGGALSDRAASAASIGCMVGAIRMAETRWRLRALTRLAAGPPWRDTPLVARLKGFDRLDGALPVTAYPPGLGLLLHTMYPTEHIAVGWLPA
jgi:hypothetical protein